MNEININLMDGAKWKDWGRGGIIYARESTRGNTSGNARIQKKSPHVALA